jgi:hypothetical protein
MKRSVQILCGPFSFTLPVATNPAARVSFLQIGLKAINSFFSAHDQDQACLPVGRDGIRVRMLSLFLLMPRTTCNFKP